MNRLPEAPAAADTTRRSEKRIYSAASCPTDAKRIRYAYLGRFFCLHDALASAEYPAAIRSHFAFDEEVL